MAGGRSRVLIAVRELIAEHGYSPSMREISARSGVQSPAGVRDHLRALRADGLVTFEDRHTRTVRLVDEREVAGA